MWIKFWKVCILVDSGSFLSIRYKCDRGKRKTWIMLWTIIYHKTSIFRWTIGCLLLAFWENCQSMLHSYWNKNVETKSLESPTTSPYVVSSWLHHQMADGGHQLSQLTGTSGWNILWLAIEKEIKYTNNYYSYQCVSARKTKLQCVSNGDRSFMHQPIHIVLLLFISWISVTKTQYEQQLFVYLISDILLIKNITDDVCGFFCFIFLVCNGMWVFGWVERVGVG